MSRFRRQRREVPGLNMAAMPDLIFTVLFFFMIVTHMRDVSPKVSYEVPQGTELEKVGRKAGVVYLFIGKPIDAQGNVLSGETRIQLNDRYVEVEEIGAAIAQERARLPQGEQQLTVNMRADRDTEMGLVNDVKLQLRKAGALQINYSATSKGERVKR